MCRPLHICMGPFSDGSRFAQILRRLTFGLLFPLVSSENTVYFLRLQQEHNRNKASACLLSSPHRAERTHLYTLQKPLKTTAAVRTG